MPFIRAAGLGLACTLLTITSAAGAAGHAARPGSVAATRTLHVWAAPTGWTKAGRQLCLPPDGPPTLLGLRDEGRPRPVGEAPITYTVTPHDIVTLEPPALHPDSLRFVHLQPRAPGVATLRVQVGGVVEDVIEVTVGPRALCPSRR